MWFLIPLAAALGLAGVGVYRAMRGSNEAVWQPQKVAGDSEPVTGIPAVLTMVNALTGEHVLLTALVVGTPSVSNNGQYTLMLGTTTTGQKLYQWEPGTFTEMPRGYFASVALPAVSTSEVAPGTVPGTSTTATPAVTVSGAAFDEFYDSEITPFAYGRLAAPSQGRRFFRV